MESRKLKGSALNRIVEDPDMAFMDGMDDFDKLKSVFDLIEFPKKNTGDVIIFGTGGSLDNKNFKNFYNDSFK